jgi:hypothetical protein
MSQQLRSEKAIQPLVYRDARRNPSSIDATPFSRPTIPVSIYCASKLQTHLFGLPVALGQKTILFAH